MVKYYRFEYETGCCQSETREVARFPDDATEEEVTDVFKEWYEEKRTDSGGYKEISKEEAERDGIDQDYAE